MSARGGGAPQVNTLRADIRRVVDQAERRLAQPEIYAKLTLTTTLGCLAVTVAYMLRDRQLSRRKATRAVHDATGARFVYGPGARPVCDQRERAMRKAPVKGFMQAARERRAKARARSRLAAGAAAR